MVLYRYKTFRSIFKFTKTFSVFSKKHYRVTILGAAGGVGQPLCLLLKENPLVSSLVLYDIHKITKGVAVDLSHINTITKVEAYNCVEQLPYALYGSHVVVIAAGIPHTSAKSTDDLFNINAKILCELTFLIARYTPCAMICVITNPINSTVPLVAEVLKKCQAFSPNRVFGITKLDLIRASTLVASMDLGVSPNCQYVPVIGGNSKDTMVPLLSLSKPPIFLSDAVAYKLTKLITNAGSEVEEAKCGVPATLSMAFAAERFIEAILKGLSGEKNIVEFAYVESDVTAAKYFSTPVVLGCNGIECNLGIPTGLSVFEKRLVEKSVLILQDCIAKATKFVGKMAAHDKK